MITTIDGHRTQTPEQGNILTNGEVFSYEVALGDGMPEWEEILDSGQLEPIQAEIVN